MYLVTTFIRVSVLILMLFCSKSLEVMKVRNTKEIDFVDLLTDKNVKPIGKSINSAGWSLKFSDEFSFFDKRKWVKSNSKKSRASRKTIGVEKWFWKPENVSYDKGNLILKSSKVASNTMNCGAIIGSDKYEFKYGYVETRIEITETDFGSHTAFWLQGNNMNNVDESGKDGAEIDVFESAWLNDYTKSVVHIDGYGKATKAKTIKYNTPNIHLGFHTYGLLWTKNKLEIYYDGVLKTSYLGKWVPNVNEYLWLSTGASFGDKANFNIRAINDFTTAKIDYIRIWELDK